MRTIVLLAALLLPPPLVGQTVLVVITGIGGEDRYDERFHTWAATLMDAATELKSLLGLSADRNEFYVTDRIVRRMDNEILIQTRSMLAILSFLGLGVEVPEADIDANQVIATPAHLLDVIEKRGPMRIRVQKERPEDPFAAVQYRNQWFYIDATDHLSKRTFSTIQLLFELLAPSGVGATPLLSLPAG